MFTGLIRATGEIVRLERASSGARLVVSLGGLIEAMGPVAVGDSVAVSGACLTVTAARDDAATFDVVDETLRLTTLGAFVPGTKVNLESALRAGDAIGGHFVLGHVDGTATLRSRRAAGEGAELEFALAPEFCADVVPKGSVAVDGVSLTVARLVPDGFAVAVVPHTLEATTLGGVRPGGKVNVETDILVKSVRRALSGPGAHAKGGGIGLDFLRGHGFA